MTATFNTEPGTGTALVIDQVAKTFGETVALEPLSFRVEAGEFVVVIGPSGCGKSTLLHIIAGLLPPTGGQVWLENAREARFGVVFQEPGLFPWRTLLDNVAFGLEEAGVAKAERVQKVKAILELVGLSGFEKSYPHQLSGGMKQRAAIARAMVINPPVLLMDEPFSALDAQTRRLLQLELARIHQESGKTTLFITHALDEAVLLADRIVVLSARPGRIQGIVEVDLPRPRGEDTQLEPEYARLVEDLWLRIKTQVEETA
jgi:NitT/TauT family transport system ATP-binding protein